MLFIPMPALILEILIGLETLFAADNYRIGNLKEGKNSDNSEIEVEGDPEVKPALKKCQAEIIQNAESTEEKR